MRKFNKKYISALVLSCVASMALASPDDGVAYGAEDAVQATESSSFAEGLQKIFYNPETCCSNVGSIISGILQVGFAAAGASTSKHDRNLVKLEDIGKPAGYNGVPEAFLTEYGINNIPPSYNGLISGWSGLFPFSGFPSGLTSLIPNPISLVPGSVLLFGVPSLLGASSVGLLSLGASTTAAPWSSAASNFSSSILSIPSVAPIVSLSSFGSSEIPAIGSSSFGGSILGSALIPTSSALVSLPLSGSSSVLGSGLWVSSSALGSVLALPLAPSSLLGTGAVSSAALGLSTSSIPSLSSIPLSWSGNASAVLSLPSSGASLLGESARLSSIGSLLSFNSSSVSSFASAPSLFSSSIPFAPASLLGSAALLSGSTNLVFAGSAGTSASSGYFAHSLGASALISAISAPISATLGSLSSLVSVPGWSVSSVPYTLAVSLGLGAGSSALGSSSLYVSSSIPLGSAAFSAASSSGVGGSLLVSALSNSIPPSFGLGSASAGLTLLASGASLGLSGSVPGLSSIPSSLLPSVTSSGIPASAFGTSSAIIGSSESFVFSLLPSLSSFEPAALLSGSVFFLPGIFSAVTASGLGLSSVAASSLIPSVPALSSTLSLGSLPASSSSAGQGSSSVVTGISGGLSFVGASSAATSGASTLVSSSSLNPSSVPSAWTATSLGSSSVANFAASGLSSVGSLSSLAVPFLLPSSSLTSGSINATLGASSSIGGSSSLIPTVSSSSSVPSISSAGPSASVNQSLALSSFGSALSTPAGQGLASSSLASLSAPSSWKVASDNVSISATSALGLTSATASGLSWRVFHPNLSTWKYGYADFDYFGKSDDFEFRNLVTFGDSLSDTGSFGRGSIYLADGNPYAFYNSYLSLLYTGKINTPERVGGSNYGMSGAVLRTNVFDPLSWVIPRDSLQKQVKRYLAQNGGAANENDLFVIWGGGNDVTADIQTAILKPWNWGKVLNGFAPTDNYFSAAANVPGELAGQLNAAGAKAPIVILNLPSSAYTAFTGVVIPSIVDSNFILINDTPFDVLNIGRWAMAAQDAWLRNPAHRVGDLAAGNGQEYFRTNTVNGMKAVFFLVPRPILEWVFDLSFNAQNNVVNLFNNNQQRTVEAIVGGAKNIVQLDINGLFGEIIADPLSFGIDEILVPECTIGHVAPACDEGDKWYHGNDGKRYMYTDWHHPSALTHRIIAEYIASTINAPAYIASLSRSLETGAKARTDYLKSELTRVNARPYEGQGQTYVFGGFSGGYSKENRSLNNRGIVYNGLNIGFGYRPAEGVDIGLLGSLGYSKVKPHKNLKFDQKDYGISAFAQYTTGPWWVNGILTAARTNFDDIKRTVVLGDNARAEKGDTKGKTYGGAIEAGYEFLAKDTWVVAPFLGYTKYRYNVDAFEEEGNSSSSMRFNKQKRDLEYVTLGLRISDDCPDDSQLVRGSIDIALNRNVNYDKSKVIGEGGLKRFNTTFEREAGRLVKDSKTWFEIKPTVQFKISNHARITTSVNYAFDTKNKSQNKNLSYSLGYRQEL